MSSRLGKLKESLILSFLKDLLKRHVITEPPHMQLKLFDMVQKIIIEEYKHLLHEAWIEVNKEAVRVPITEPVKFVNDKFPAENEESEF
jgi:hypothetical protein